MDSHNSYRFLGCFSLPTAWEISRLTLSVVSCGPQHEVLKKLWTTVQTLLSVKRISLSFSETHSRIFVVLVLFHCPCPLRNVFCHKLMISDAVLIFTVSIRLNWILCGFRNTSINSGIWWVVHSENNWSLISASYDEIWGPTIKLPNWNPWALRFERCQPQEKRLSRHNYFTPASAWTGKLTKFLFCNLEEDLWLLNNNNDFVLGPKVGLSALLPLLSFPCIHRLSIVCNPPASNFALIELSSNDFATNCWEESVSRFLKFALSREKESERMLLCFVNARGFCTTISRLYCTLRIKPIRFVCKIIDAHDICP